MYDSITLMPGDVKNIADSLESLNHNLPVKIIDTGKTITLRDHTEGFLSEIEKEEFPKPEHQA